MASEREGITEHSYSDALSRLSMFLGVPVEIFGVILMITVCVFINAQSFKVVFFAFPVWLAAYLICLKDPDLLRIYFLKLTTFGIDAFFLNKKFWNARRSYMP